jgi:hypothetical protein
MDKHNSTQKTETGPLAGRYVRLEIRVPLEDYERGLPYFGTRKNLNQYAVEALMERINRAEANDKAGRLKKLLTDEDLLMAVLKHMKETGKLNSLIS